MKKLLFFAVSAILAGAGYCASVGEKIAAKVTNGGARIGQQQELALILEQPSADSGLLTWHGSHSSHSSHGSHGSHSSHGSHTSHYSSWL